MTDTPDLRVVIENRFTIPGDNLPGLMEHLEVTEDPERIRGARYLRFTLRGVPAKRCDVIVLAAIAARLQAGEPIDRTVLFEAVRKSGKYDGGVRRRYAVRRLGQRDEREASATHSLRVVAQGGIVYVNVRRTDDVVEISEIYDQLRADLDGYNLARVPGWQWRRYFTHLTDQDEMRAFCDAWAVEVAEVAQGWTLAEANRHASRALYRLSVELGWCKLPLGARVRLFGPEGADMPQWQRRDEVVLPAIAAYRCARATGCGEATHRAAAACGDLDRYSADMTEAHAPV